MSTSSRACHKKIEHYNLDHANDRKGMNKGKVKISTINVTNTNMTKNQTASIAFLHGKEVENPGITLRFCLAFLFLFKRAYVVSGDRASIILGR